MSRCKGLEVLYPIPEGRWNEHAVPVSCSPTLTNVPWGKGARQMPFSRGRGHLRQTGLVERKRRGLELGKAGGLGF